MMKHLTSLLLALAASSAFAHVDISCPAMAKEEKRPQTELQKKLESDGWKVSKIEEANGCYEVHATDGKGAEVEASFNPKTFDRVYPRAEKPARKK